QRALHEELEARLGALELVAAALEVLQLVEESAHLQVLSLHVDAELTRLVDEIAAAGEVGEQDALRVTDERRIDVLVDRAVALHGRDVEAALMRDRRLPDVRLALRRLAVGELVDEVRERLEA